MKVECTGYWTFFCNPAKWDIDGFLSANHDYDDYLVTNGQADWFHAGQLGLVRVGTDKRSRDTLAGRKRLKLGVYGVVQVLREARLWEGNGDQYWLVDAPPAGHRRTVDIRYLKNLKGQPVLIRDLRALPEITDKYLLEGFQASTMPLDAATFEKIISLIGTQEQVLENVELKPTDTAKQIRELELKYSNAVPEVKEVISKRIERGAVANKVKKKFMGFKCMICMQLGRNPIAFRKKNGEPYVEAHHVYPVGKKTRGALGPSNLITVCANHHRQLHFGNSELMEVTETELAFRIDKKLVRVKRVRL